MKAITASEKEDGGNMENDSVKLNEVPNREERRGKSISPFHKTDFVALIPSQRYTKT